MKLNLYLSLILTLFLSSCGGGNADRVVLRIEDPALNERFAPGETLNLRIAVDNFEFEAPVNISQQNHHRETGDHSLDLSTDDTAREVNNKKGHYHVYLDACVGPHITSWHLTEDHGTTQVSVLDYELPVDISSGEHFICVDLRNSDHEALGIIATVDIIVEQ